MGDAVLGVLLEKLVTFIQNEARYICEFPRQSTKLKDELQLIRSFLNDIDQLKKKDQKETLKTISQKLREVLYDADDFMADYERIFVKQQQQQASICMMRCSLSFLIFRYQKGKKLGSINQEIGSLREWMKSYLDNILSLPNQERVNKGSHPVRHTFLIDEAEVVGLNDDLKKIMEWIWQADWPLTVIGIVGMGGIGKTTLAQKIYNNDDVKRHFTQRLIVVISQSFELKEIIKDMLRKLEVKEESLMRDEIGLFHQLQDQLSEKYLLILDDIWNTDEGGSSWWESLKSALPKRNDGSCVIVTTRKEKVARLMGATESHIHHLQLLSEENCWSLFSKLVFAREGQCPNPELDHIGKEIVGQCNGLPLAIKVVGGIMLGKELSFFEWKQVSDHLKEELVVHERIELVLFTLRLSYEELPMHLKPCMLCFASFPEDFEISKDEMIYCWIGEGFIRGKDTKTAYEIGEEWWIELISRGLLLAVRKDDFERVVYLCRVHDMVRDMIIEIVKEENFMSWDDMGNPSMDIQSRRVSIMKNTIGRPIFRELNPKLLRLRTLIWINIKEREFITTLYQLKWLRVLVLEFTDAYVLPEVKDDWWSGIGLLSHLIYLKIKNSRSLEKLPDSIGNLQNLQVIWIESCPFFKMLPAQVTSLKKLTNISIYCPEEHYPLGIENLSNLEELGVFTPACSVFREGSRVLELQKLTKLRQLYIKIYSEDAIGAEELHVLSQLKQLKYLRIIFGITDGEEEEQFLRKVHYDIAPCHQLQELYLENYLGEETPAWLNPTTLPNLRFLKIDCGKMRRMHPGFFGKSEEENREENRVWRLEALYLEWLDELEEEWPRMQRAMPSLRLLKVDRCPMLKFFPCNVYGKGIWRK